METLSLSVRLKAQKMWSCAFIQKIISLHVHQKKSLRWQKVSSLFTTILSSTTSVLFAISVDSVESQAEFVKEYEIPYVHLSDPKKIACKKYAGTNIAGLAKRSTFVIGIDGVIHDVMREINVTSHGQEILASLNKIKV